MLPIIIVLLLSAVNGFTSDIKSYSSRRNVVRRRSSKQTIWRHFQTPFTVHNVLADSVTSFPDCSSVRRISYCISTTSLRAASTASAFSNCRRNGSSNEQRYCSCITTRGRITQEYRTCREARHLSGFYKGQRSSTRLSVFYCGQADLGQFLSCLKLSLDDLVYFPVESPVPLLYSVRIPWKSPISGPLRITVHRVQPALLPIDFSSSSVSDKNLPNRLEKQLYLTASQNYSCAVDQ